MILFAIAIAAIGYVAVLTWLWPTDLEAEAQRRLAGEPPLPRPAATVPAKSEPPASSPAATSPAAAPAPASNIAAPAAPAPPAQVVTTPTLIPSPPITAPPAPPGTVWTPPRPPPGFSGPVDPFADDPYAPQPPMSPPTPAPAPRSETGRPAAPVIAAELRNAATESLLAQVRADPFEFARLYHVDLDAAQAIADGRTPMPEEIIRSRAGL